MHFNISFEISCPRNNSITNELVQKNVIILFPSDIGGKECIG
jgi:hypothetical protein